MQITINLDSKGYKKKPAQAEIGAVSNRTRVSDSQRTIDASTLKDYVTKGITFTPAALNGANSNNWISQQLICIDIDNETFLKDEAGNIIKDEKGKQIRIQVDNPTAPEQAQAILKAYNIEPLLMYKTFNYTDTWQRYRVVILLAEKLTDVKKAMDYTERVCGIIPNADRAIATPERLIFAGTADSVILDNPNSITPLEVLERLPQPVKAAAEVKPGITNNGNIAKPIDQIKIQPVNLSQTLTTDQMQERLKNDIDNFDMMQFITGTSSAKQVRVGNTLYAAPCPVCGRDSKHLQIRGNSWQCYDTNNTTGKKGGTIIDYLMAVYGLSKAEAMDKFEYDIMGYSREEKKAAYKQEQQAIENKIAAEYKKTAPQPAEAPQELNKNYIETFLDKIQSEAYKPYKTELPFFDNLLKGGMIRQTLLLLVAAPGAGKTTLCQQIGEAMAEHKKPVYYINLEMSREQMLSKTISCRLARRGVNINSLDIMQGYKWTDEQRAEIVKELSDYELNILPYMQYSASDTTNNIDIIIKRLREAGEAAKKAGTEAPAVIIDYLHLLSADKASDNQEVLKSAVTQLKKYAIDYNTVVIAIAAANRDAMKKGQLSMQAVRDSSNLEYTADYQLSLNYADVDSGEVDPQTDISKLSTLQAENPRRMIIRVLKSRFSAAGECANVYFYTAQNRFEEWVKDDNAEPFNNKMKSIKRY